MCQKFNQLPHAGGLLDQDQLYVQYMQMVLEQQALRQEKDQKEAEAKRKSEAAKTKRSR